MDRTNDNRRPSIVKNRLDATFQWKCCPLVPYLLRKDTAMDLTNDNEHHPSTRRNGLDLTDNNSERKMLRRELTLATAPLDIDEEREVFREMARAAISGDNARRNKLRMRIFHAHMPLACNLAKKAVWQYREFYGEYVSDLLDLTHVAYGALFQAIEKFQVEAGNRFSTYATIAIRNELNSANGMRKRREYKVGPMARLDEPIRDSNGRTWLDILGDDRSAPIPDEVSDYEKSTLLESAMQRLSRRERDLVSAKFNLGDGNNRRRLQDVAGLYGISPQRASQIVKAAIDKLHKAVAA